MLTCGIQSIHWHLPALLSCTNIFANFSEVHSISIKCPQIYLSFPPGNLHYPSLSPYKFVFILFINFKTEQGTSASYLPTSKQTRKYFNETCDSNTSFVQKEGSKIVFMMRQVNRL